MSGRSRKAAYYDLGEIQEIIRRSPANCRITQVAIDRANSLGLTHTDIYNAILELDDGKLHKSMETVSNPKFKGTWQDVYRYEYKSEDLYIKLQMIRRGTPTVISFKRWGEP